MATKFIPPTQDEVDKMTFEEAVSMLRSMHEATKLLQPKVQAGLEEIQELAGIEVKGPRKPGATAGTSSGNPRVDATALAEIKAAGAAGIEEADLIAKITAKGFPEDKVRKALASRAKGKGQWWAKKGSKYYQLEK